MVDGSDLMYAQLLEEIQLEFPDFKIIQKSESKLMKVLNFLLLIISFGQAREFMTHFTTTLGTKVYVTDDWDTDEATSRISLLRHERIHMRQARKYSQPLFSFLYLFVLFPIGLAYFRMKFEKEAYAESVKADIELHGTYRVLSPEYKAWLAGQFTGAGYLWTWPFKKSIDMWVTKTIDDAIDGHVSKK